MIVDCNNTDTAINCVITNCVKARKSRMLKRGEKKIDSDFQAIHEIIVGSST